MQCGSAYHPHQHPCGPARWLRRKGHKGQCPHPRNRIRCEHVHKGPPNRTQQAGLAPATSENIPCSHELMFGFALLHNVKASTSGSPSTTQRTPTGRGRQSLCSLHGSPGKLGTDRRSSPSTSSMGPPRATDVPLAPLQPPPVAERVGVRLPAATFLTEVPTLPGNVRVDCGYSRSKDFLLSGLPRHPHPHVTDPSPGPSWALTMQHEEPQELVSSGMMAPGQGPRGTYASAQNPAGTLGAQIVDDVLRSSQGQGQESDTVVVSHYILSALSNAHHSQPVVGVAPDLATGRRVKTLPQEQALPRRHVPGLGK